MVLVPSPEPLGTDEEHFALVGGECVLAIARWHIDFPPIFAPNVELSGGGFSPSA